MGGLWIGGLGPSVSPQGLPHTGAADARNMAFEARNGIRELEHQVERLSLLNQALWELLRERTKLTDADLLAKAKEVDLRDGQEDEAISMHPVRCPSCQRICNSKHFKCIYCGQEFERSVFG